MTDKKNILQKEQPLFDGSPGMLLYERGGQGGVYTAKSHPQGEGKVVNFWYSGMPIVFTVAFDSHVSREHEERVLQVFNEVTSTPNNAMEKDTRDIYSSVRRYELPDSRYCSLHSDELFRKLIKRLHETGVALQEIMVQNYEMGVLFSIHPEFLKSSGQNFQSKKSAVGYFHYAKRSHIPTEYIEELKKSNDFLIEEKNDWYFIYKRDITELCSSSDGDGNQVIQPSEKLMKFFFKTLDIVMDHYVKDGVRPPTLFLDDGSVYRFADADGHTALEMAKKILISFSGVESVQGYAIAADGYVNSEGSKQDATIFEVGEKECESAFRFAQRYQKKSGFLRPYKRIGNPGYMGPTENYFGRKEENT